MTNALTSDGATWFGYILKDLWKFFAWITIPGTNITIAEALVSMAAISIITWFLKSYSGTMRETKHAREAYHKRQRAGGSNGE